MALEEFQGFDQTDKMDAASFEKFKDRMKAAAAQIQAIKKEEKKRKKKEDELVKILLKFIQNSHKKDLVLLISRALEKNIPANFILAVVLLGNEDIQKEVGEYLMLPGMKDQIEAAANATNATNNEGQIPLERSLIFFQDDASLPLKVRIEVDHWISNMLYQAAEAPTRLLATAYDYIEVDDEEAPQDDEDSLFGDEKKKSLKKIVTERLARLASHIIFDFLMQNGIEEDIVKLKEFSQFILKGILGKTKEDIDNRKELGGQTA